MFAQNLDIRGFGGWNTLQLSSDDGTSIIDGIVHDKVVSGRPGYQFGASVGFGERFYIEPGIMYSTFSTKVVNKNTVKGNELTDETTIKVFSVPMKVGFKLINPEVEEIFNVRVFAGLVGSHVIGVDHTTKSGVVDDISTDDYTNLIINADFGMGVDLLFFFADAGYHLGMTPVHSGADNAKANSFYINVGLKLSL